MQAKIATLDEELYVNNVTLDYDEATLHGRLLVAWMYYHTHAGFFEGIRQEIENLEEPEYRRRFFDEPVFVPPTREERHNQLIKLRHEEQYARSN
jgi:hypothetical protein